MRRQRLSTLLAAVAAVLALSAAAPALAQQAAQTPSLDGTYTLNTTASEDVNRAIEQAVARMNFITRPIARGRLKRTNQPYQRILIQHTQGQVSITTDQRAPIRTPANGTPIKWRREDGEMFDVSTEWENGSLEQTFAAEDGRRVNSFSVSPDGRTLTMEVTVTSPRLSQPLRYRLVYNRA